MLSKEEIRAYQESRKQAADPVKDQQLAVLAGLAREFKPSDLLNVRDSSL